jgi:hypothetical protein
MTGGTDIENLFDWYKQNEHPILGKVPEEIHSLYCYINPPINNLGFETLPIYRKLAPKVTEPFVAWFVPQTRGNPVMLDAIIGYHGYAFWKEHPSNEPLSLEWLESYVGPGRLQEPDEFFWWVVAAQNKQNISLFDLMEREQFYRYDQSISSVIDDEES